MCPTTQPTAPLSERAAAPEHLDLPPAELGLTWRPLRPTDAAELHALAAASETHEELPFRTSAEEIAESFDGSWRDPEHDTLGGWDADGVLRAQGRAEVAPGDERTVRVFLDGTVHPEWRGRGVGRHLLAWQLGRARQLLAASGKELPARIAGFAEDVQADRHRLLRAGGLTPIRYYAEMDRPLDTEPGEVAAPDGVAILPWSERHEEAARLAHNEAFADHWGSEPRTVEQWRSGRAHFVRQWSFLAVQTATDAVVGYVQCRRYQDDWEAAGHTAGYIDLLGVVRPWRGRRVAVALLTAAMRAFRADGMEYAEIGVDTANPSGAHGLYTSLGFTPRHSSVMYSIEL